MSTCFVIQPFDNGVYDKRYEDIFADAIRAANLEPYRVDQDPSASVPIEDIEAGIRRADVCFAEISTDNPNVWFELGFAIASAKGVVLVCSNDRKNKFPFDVQHRRIIQYISESPRDFEKLKQEITRQLIALVEKQTEMSKLSDISYIPETEGLSQQEIVALVCVAQNMDSPTDGTATYGIRQDMRKAGFSDIAVSLGLRGLLKKQFAEFYSDIDYNGDEFDAYRATEKGFDWLENNQDKIVIKQQYKEPETSFQEEELPF